MVNRILVTGAAGLLGTSLIKRLLKENQPVRALYRSRMPEQLLDQSNIIEWIKGDILDVYALQEAMEGCAEVYHCAGLVSFNPARAGDLIKINQEGTANVVNVALETGVQKLVHVSSVAAIGRKRNNQTVHEELKWDDRANPSVYGMSKYLAELEVWRGIAEGLNAVIVNPTIILGVGDWDHGSAATFKNAYREFPWYTEGISGFVDVEDVAELMSRLMKSEIQSERYIISAENWSFRTVFEEMANAFGKKAPSLMVSPALAALVWRWEKVKGYFSGSDPLLTKETAETAQQKVYFDNSKIKNAFPDFSFKPLKETIDLACKAYLKKLDSEK